MSPVLAEAIVPGAFVHMDDLSPLEALDSEESLSREEVDEVVGWLERNFYRFGD